MSHDCSRRSARRTHRRHTAPTLGAARLASDPTNPPTSLASLARPALTPPLFTSPHLPGEHFQPPNSSLDAGVWTAHLGGERSPRGVKASPLGSERGVGSVDRRSRACALGGEGLRLVGWRVLLGWSERAQRARVGGRSVEVCAARTSLDRSAPRVGSSKPAFEHRTGGRPVGSPPLYIIQLSPDRDAPGPAGGPGFDRILSSGDYTQ